MKRILLEFLRYAVVGGIAFLADMGTMVVCQELLFKTLPGGVYVSVFLGFLVGLAVNYALSLKFVFTQDKDKGKGRSVGAFLVFGVVGVVGLGLTELGMWVGVSFLACNYIVVKAMVTAIVLAWNYIGRKVAVFR